MDVVTKQYPNPRISEYCVWNHLFLKSYTDRELRKNKEINVLPYMFR